MADNEEQIEIELDEPEKKAAEPEIKVEKAEDAPKKPEKREIDPDEGIESLRNQLEKERATRIEMERRARAAAEAEFKAKNEAQDSNLHLVTNAIESVKQTTEVLKTNYAAAMSAGDYERAAEIQQAMSNNAAKLLQLEQGKQALEAMPRQTAPESIGVTDPVEHLASQLTPRSAAWIRRHPQYATDKRLNVAMLGAHNVTVSHGIEPDTDEYFESIETMLKIRRPVETQEDPMAEAAKPTQKRTPPPAAPVSRSSGGPGSRPNTVRLTSQEREIAGMMGMTVEEYAKHKLALQREGKLN